MATGLDYFWKKKTILSFVAIFLVIIIHSSATNQYLLPEDNLTSTASFIRNLTAYSIGSIAVPLFFFLSGIAFFRNYSNKLYFKKLHSRIKTLLIPYFFWNIVGLLFAVLYTYTPLSELITGREAFSPTPENILEGVFLYKYNFAFWFLFYLIIFTILTPIFNLLLSKKWLALITATLLLITPLFIKNYNELNLDCILFYFLGCYFGKYHLKEITKKAPLKLSLISLFTTIILITIKLLQIYNILVLPDIVSELILITLLFSVWFSSDLLINRIKKRAYHEEFFPIYTLHTYIIAIIVKLFCRLAPKTSLFLLINELVSPILTVTITIIVALLLRRLLPKFYSFIFGRKTN